MMRKFVIVIGAVIAGVSLLNISFSRGEQTAANEHSQSSVERGRYLVRISGCNDCHTPGFMQLGDKVPEVLWLTGTPVGWRGPWGTTYASNLRLFIKPFSEDDFVKVCRTRNDRPPMPWPSLHAMNDADLRAVYQYIKALSPAGEATPSFVPPGQEPKTPYVSLMPQLPTTRPANASASGR